ncbi:non-ribosomal peptide synthase/polyketide synthase [Pyxidicoccus sp. QH1ED-7-1]|nr:non-ribosomal peptide synthase/polyketide synthase [Pyxidicoccus xibeiensis]
MRDWLRERLPEYMVPSAFMLLEALPLTPNGKVDRGALPEPEQQRAQGTEYVAPREGTEARLAALFAEVLAVEKVGARDDFFELGGHSLMATRLISRIRSAFDVELPLRALFEAPSVAALALAVDGAMASHAGRKAPPLERASREARLPLSFAQQRLWFLDRMGPGGSHYNIPMALRIEGALDAGVLDRCLTEIVRRHEVLRTTFTEDAQGPVQVIAPPPSSVLKVEDLSGLSAAAREAEARLRAAREMQLPFDLIHGPMVRAMLLRLDAHVHVLLLTVHHISSDAWSTGLLVREVMALYEAFSAGRTSPLPELRFQYADHAAWQRGWLRGETLEEQLSYWRQQLGGAPSHLELPTDLARPPVRTYNGAELTVMLPPALQDGLRELARREGVTLFMLLLGAWQTLLARDSGQDDISVGSPIAGRHHGETEELIGFFVNTLVLRTRLSDDLTFRELLARVRETALGAYAHQDVPFEKLVEELRPERDMSRPPLYQVMFMLQNAPASALEVPGLKMSAVETASTSARHELTLTAQETPQGLATTLEFNTDLFVRSTAERVLNHLRSLLENIVANPEQRLRELSRVSEAERAQVLVSFNDTTVAFPREATVHALFSAQAARTPDAIAVEFQGQRLTYRELDARSSQLAWHLLSLGVRPGSFVAVCLERGLHLPTALLAILKTGAAFVPLDPAYPSERLAFMLGDTRAPVLLTQDRLANLLPPLGELLLTLEEVEPLLAAYPSHAPAYDVGGEAPAYVMYTSGSTGQPKGVLTPHRGIVRLLLGSSFTPFGPDETFLHLAPISFDASTFEIWGALLHGSRLVVFPPQTPSLQELARFISSHAISTLWLTTALFEQMMAHHADVLDGVRQVLTGGEVLSVARARQRLERGQAFVNAYGPTESTTFATCFPMSSLEQVGATISIGTPIANTSVYLLDSHQHLVPVGVRGELYIGGEGLALGYLHRPELTAERFLPNPFSTEPGARMYRTGDLARWLPDGRLEFCGRADAQVKVRGFRIEPGEIEATLLAHPLVLKATVIVREDVPGDKRLVAYVVLHANAPDTKTLRDFLHGRLPEYMVPSAFVAMEALPLSPSGKVDRKALPAPESSASRDDTFVAPSTPTEELLASLWADVLHLEKVGAHDNFFELGGHSLLATQVISRIRDTFQVELPLRDLFEVPTLTALAARIDSAVHAGHGLQAPPLVPVSRDTALPLSFAQQRLWFIDQLEPGSALYNILTPVRLKGPLNVSALERSFQSLVERHEALRTTFVATNGQPAQLISPPGSFFVPVLDVSALPEAHREAEARRLTAEEYQRPFDLTRGPLLRATLLRLDAADHILLLTMHHIVSDGWSMGVLIREMTAFYAAFTSGQSLVLPPLPVQYADFASWQRGWLQGAAMEAQLGWWREQLRGAPSYLDLPTDRPRPAVPAHRGELLPIHLSAELSERMRELCRHEGATPFMLLLACFQVLLSRYTGQDDISVGSTIAGRNRGETEGLIGFFVNNLVLRTRLSDDLTFRELLARVRETTLGAYAHQDVPFEKLVEELQPVRDLSRPPLFQVVLGMLNAEAPRVTPTGSDLAVLPVEVDHRAAKFDMTLNFSETPGGFAGTLEYDTDLFERSTAERVLSHLRSLLENLVANPEQRLRELSLSSEAERAQVLVSFNDTTVAFPREATVHALFSAQAARTPDAIAVEFQGQHLTYRELDARSSQLAWHLLSLGVRPGSFVAVCLERGLHLPTTLLAILKTGAAFVPLDPAYPSERLAFMLGDTRAPVLLTQDHLADQLPSRGELLLTLEEVEPLLAGYPSHSPAYDVGGEAPAYVMYTSGSTGQPKGVLVPHRGIVRLVSGSSFIHFGPEESFLQFAPISFDASTLELWGALLHGSRLVVFPPQTPSLQELARFISSHAISTLWLTAALFDQMMAHHPDALDGVRQVLAGGDVLSVARVRQRLERGHSLVNGYGPTESTTFAACFPMDSAQQVGASVSIGRPIANTAIYLLDSHLRPVPVGVRGELYIGGEGLALGYLHRPELTAERFLPNPFVPGARMYRTGDLARWLPDGRLDFFGRADAQVKVRGFRIEPGEIEATLLAHPLVLEASVIAREDVPGDKRLVAYVVPEAGQSLDTKALRDFVHGRLPEYMVPSAFVAMEALPLSPNGKVDRKALPAPESSASREDTFVAPSTPTEQLLATLWAEVLHLEKVSAHDDFFELGGHSLLATQVISRIRDTFQVELPLRDLFEAPTLIALAARIDSAVNVGHGLQAPPLVPVSRDTALPLSFAQQRLWFIDQLEPGNPAYNIFTALRLDGTLDPSALERSFQALVERHEALRTTFSATDGQPTQVISAPAAFSVPVVDLSALPDAHREAEARRLAAQEGQRPFDLARGPLLRATVLRLDAVHHVLLLTMHHIVSDGWSMGVLIREMTDFYAAFTSGRPPALSELPVQYADFASWQRGWLQGDTLKTQLGWWREQLSGAPAALELPTDRARPSVQSFRGATLPVHLPRAISQSLLDLCQREGVTPFMALLSAFQLLLGRYSGQDDVTVGSPIAGRNRAETEGLIGFFVNTLVLRTRLDGAQTYRELLARVRETTLGAYAHQDVPFEKLVEELQPARDLGRSPLFQVMFTLQNAPVPSSGEAPAPSGPDLQVRPLDIPGSTAQFDLSLTLSQSDDGFSGFVSYATDLFDASTVERMVGHLNALVEAAVSAPDRRLRQLSLLSEGERHQLDAWNATDTAFPSACLHHLFEAQAARTPDATALTFETEHLTYRQLDERSNRLAWHLRSLGVGPEVRVALALERSFDLVVALFATLKAGGAYVPLEPSNPQERLAFMLGDCAPAVLLTTRALQQRLPQSSVTTLCLDALPPEVASLPAHAPDSGVLPGHLAYVIYTSGSTGTPKGAMNAHGAVVNRLLWMQQHYGLTSSDAVLQKTPYAFDVSVWEFFWPLLSGARLVLARPGGHQDPAYLARLIQQQRISTLHFVPSMLAAFLDEPSSAGCDGVRRVLCSGEALPAELASRCLETLPAAELHNLYGPTEAAVDVTAWHVRPGSFRASVPIGLPVSNTRIHLLDASLAPVPVGVPGELFISGLQVGRGYLSRPALTAEKFLPDPFSPSPGARMYRTGDLARRLPDGSIDYLGRTDFQVKLRGFRIELGEVEAALCQHPTVRDAVLLAREDVPGDKRLVAYLTPRHGQTLSVDVLRQHLLARLPEYMVPSAFVPLEALPLSANGKVDRKALPAPTAPTAAARDFVAPRNPTEELLASLWAEVLRIDRVGARDNFFELGGHSLLATQVVSRIRDAFQVELPLRELFEAPVLAALAMRVDIAVRAGHGLQAPALVPAPRKGALPLSFAQQRLWFIDQLEPGNPAYNLFTALRLDGVLDVSALERAFTVLVLRHEALRTTFVSTDGQPAQRISPPESFQVQVRELSTVPPESREDEAHQVAAQEVQRPFDLARGPLLRATLLRLDAEKHVLLLTMHHIVSDGWSMGVLTRELTTLYAAFSSGRPIPLPELPVQYADFASWQRGWLQGDVLETQLAWWREQLSGAPAALELPTDRPYPAVPSRRGASVPVSLPAALAESLDSLARHEGVTPFMALLASFQLLLARYSGQDDITVGSPIAGRNRSETEGLIGFFVNTLVLRSPLDGELTFRQLLARVRETTLGAYAHQDVPFEKLVEELHASRDLRRTPLFQVMFTLQNVPEASTQAPRSSGDGLSVSGFEARSQSTKFELTLGLTRTPDGYEGGLVYAVDLFDASTVERMVGHLHTLLTAALAQPDAQLALLPLLSDSERQQLLVTWNDTRRPVTRDACLHTLFEAQADSTPDALAVECGDEQLSFRELDSSSTQLAHHLRALGVGPDVPVALCLERSVSQVVAVFAILKAGGAYVPLDPKYPRARLDFLMRDVGAPVLVTTSRLRDTLGLEAPALVCLDSDGALLASQPTRRLDVPVGLGNLAYVLYTSGSTGTPKGVMIAHRSVANLRAALASTVYADVHGPLRVSMNAPLSFDASVKQLIQLVDGHALVIIPEEVRIDAEALLVLAERLDVLDISPSLLKLLLRAGLAGKKSGGPGRVLVGGEALDAETWAVLASHPSTRFFNVYGPTECTVDATVALASEAPERPTLGHPLSNVRLYVLDASLHPVPVGVPGELFIGGTGVGRGYWRRPELTAEKFLPDVFSSEPGARLYRTGDRVRFRQDGRVEYLGRTDFQVKVRGFRIETGEIEAVLRQHPAVADAVVMAREDVLGDTRLVAYAVPRPGHPAEPELLSRFVRERLPEYMVPSNVVLLEAFTLSSNGKVDRKALPAPRTVVAEKDFVAPRTPTEELLASLWADVLRVDRVGARDNFFEVGGHSLLATQVVSRIRDTFQVELPLRNLFEAPTLTALAARIDSAVQAGHGLQTPPLVPVSRTGALPLSFAQQRLWFIDQLEPGSPAYNIPSALRLSGPLDSVALERAFTELVRRHEALRTTFVTTDGEPSQVIFPPVAFPIAAVDLTELSPESREAEARQLVAQEVQRPFHLAHGPLLRALLLRTTEDEHVLLLTMHHIVSDGWSMGVLIRELTTLYAAFASGQPSPLPELPVQYADFASWQRGWLQGDVLETQLAWWREQLSGAPAALELPTDRPYPAVPSRRGASVPVSLPRPLAESLDSLARHEGVTPFMALLASFQLLLARYSGQDDITVGSPIAGRNRSETEGLIGFFVNTLVLRSRLDGELTFRQLLARVRETTLGAYAHQDVPFEKLVEELHASRDLRRTPLFQVMFTLQNVPEASSTQAPRSSGDGLSVSGFEAQSQSTKFELTLGLSRTSSGYEGALEYAVDLFDASTVERMVGHLNALVEAAVSAPDRRLRQLSLLSEGERHQLDAWNATDTAFPASCLHHLFEAQAALTPDATALTFESEHLSYRQLDERSNRLAWHLRSLGVGPEVRVALALERSFDLVVALFATLKAGGAYVPLEPSNPQERLAFMLGDCAPAVLLTTRALQQRLPPTPVTTLCLDALPPEVASLPAHAPDSGVLPGHLAYVIYTSGSTGTPKGAMNAHGAVVNRLLWMQQHYGLSSSDAVLQKTPYAFDVSVWEFFWPLLCGARLVLARPGGHQDPAYLARLIQQQRISTLHFVPSMLAAFLDEPSSAGCDGVRRVLCSGEALPAELASRCLTTLPAAELHNLYGPTEAAVDVTAWHVRPGAFRASVPIGLPVSNTRIHLLDASLAPVPVGVPGELFISGLQVGRGYLSRPALTAERFLPDPFSPSPGARMYRTGDLARRLPDGSIDYLGRTDFQVKLRGFRIELGEVEAALAQHPSVRDAVLLAREDVPGDKRLVAYLTPRHGQSLSVDVLRQHLLARLPEYMVPSAFVPLEALPLSPNGKVDRKALPAPTASTAAARDFVAPRNPTEELLAGLFAQLLGVSRIGIHDDFFALGGHSLLAVRLMARLQQQLGRGLPLASLFGGATVERIARMLHEEAPARPWTPLMALNTEGTRPPLFLVHPIGGSVLCYAELAQRLGADQPLYALQAPGVDGGGAPLASVEELAALYVEAIRTVQPSGPYHLGGWSFGGTVALEMARQLQRRDEQVALLALIDSSALQRTVDLSPSAVTAAFARDLALISGRELTQPDEVLASMEPDALIDLLMDEARRANILQGVPRERLESLRAVFESHRRALASYVPAPLTVPMVLLRATDSLPGQQDRGWSALASSGLRLHQVPGNHYTLLRPPHVETLARTLRECLDAVSASGTPSSQESA